LLGGVFYVRSVTTERDRADASEEDARRARAVSEASLDELTLKHAQLLLATDPSGAVDTLNQYRGKDVDRANQIRAEASGRGVALLRATPHTAMTSWIESTSDGSIISLSTDGTITKTSLQGKSSILSRNVSRHGQFAYSRARHLLAYACDPSNLCMFDVETNSHVSSAWLFRDIHPVGISFSQDGLLLALMSQDTTLRVIDVALLEQPRLRLAKKIHNGSDVVFFRRDIVIAGTPNGIEFVHMSGESDAFSIPDDSFWDAQPDSGQFAVATIQGQALLFQADPIRLVARIQLCNGPVIGLQFIPGRHDIAFGCREGHIGTWDVQLGITVLKARVDGSSLIRVNSTGEYIVTASGNGVVTMIDLTTDLTMRYSGHESRVTALTPPEPGHPFVISADVRGALRVWPVRARFAKAAVALNSQFNTVIFDKHSTTALATSYFPALTSYSPTTGARSLSPHGPYNFTLVQSDQGDTFAAYGLNELVEFWSAKTMTRTSVVNTMQGSLTQLSFVSGSDDVVTSGHDGRLVRWTSAGKGSILANLDQPIEFFALLQARSGQPQSEMVFSSFDGALWRTDHRGLPSLIRSAGARATRVIALPDHETVLAANVAGEVIAINTRSWNTETILRASSAVGDISVTQDGHWLILGTNDGFIHVGRLNDQMALSNRVTWQYKLAIRARHLAVTSDGLLIAVCSDGTIWLYALSDHRWLSLSVGNADFRWIATSTRGDAAAALDAEGHLIWIDLEAARKLLGSNQ
jgi:WD40 repeat protein